MNNNVLVLDDEEEIRLLVKRRAEKLGMNVTTAEHPGKISEADLHSYDVIVLDLMMPNIDGIQALRTLAKLNSTAKIILVSGMEERTLSAARTLAGKHGLSITGVLSKPFSYHQLDDLLENIPLPGITIEELSLDTITDFSEFREGIVADEFVVHYQPKFVIASRKICGLEALSRWEHPTHGELSPASFIHMAEAAQFAQPFALQLVSKVAADMQYLQTKLGYDMPVSLNLPLSALTDINFPEKVFKILDGHQINAELVSIEINETSIPDCPATSLDILTRLHMRGVRLSLDDYGTGHSSLERIKEIPFSELKIDRSFVTDLHKNNASLAITKNAIELSHTLGLSVVAEGVEDEQTLKELDQLHCDVAQGFLLSRPQPLAKLLQEIKSDDFWFGVFSGMCGVGT